MNHDHPELRLSALAQIADRDLFALDRTTGDLMRQTRKDESRYRRDKNAIRREIRRRGLANLGKVL